MKFSYRFFDRYNWDGDKQTDFDCPEWAKSVCGKVPAAGWSYNPNTNQVTVTDEALAELHRAGLAKEFNMYGAAKRYVEWESGGQPKITEGWPNSDLWK